MREDVAIVAGTWVHPAPGRYCNRQRKLVAYVDPGTGAVVGCLEMYHTHPPKFVEVDSGDRRRETVRLSGIELSWEDVYGSLPQGTEGLIPVAIVDCDGASKLPCWRIGERDGFPAECRLEVCCEVSADDTDPHLVPASDNTAAKRKAVLKKARRQGFPLGRLHHPTKDWKRCHCVGRLVRRLPKERAAQAREWAATARDRASELRAEIKRVAGMEAFATTVEKNERVAAVELGRAERLEAEAARLESLE